jgi:hypothetical protein
VSAHVTIDPQLASAVSARIHAHVPDARIFFAKESLEALTGHDLEQLMMAAFLMGYGDGYRDSADYCSGSPESELLAWALAHS